MPTSPEDWSQLALFLAIYRERSLSRAALRLGVDQSTVSRRLAALEDRIGDRLVSRLRETCEFCLLEGSDYRALIGARRT